MRAMSRHACWSHSAGKTLLKGQNVGIHKQLETAVFIFPSFTALLYKLTHSSPATLLHPLSTPQSNLRLSLKKEERWVEDLVPCWIIYDFKASLFSLIFSPVFFITGLRITLTKSRVLGGSRNLQACRGTENS